MNVNDDDARRKFKEHTSYDIGGYKLVVEYKKSKLIYFVNKFYKFTILDMFIIKIFM